MAQYSYQQTAQNIFCQVRTVDDLARLLKTQAFALEFFAGNPSYNEFKIPKKTGGFRLLEDPEENLKAIQRELNHYLRCCYYLCRTSAAYAFQLADDDDDETEIRNILTNAQCHLSRPWMLNADFLDFFHQVTQQEVFEIFLCPPFDFQEDLAMLWSASFGRLSTLRRKQVFFAEHLAASQWVIELFRIKLYQQKNLLVFLKDRKMAQAGPLTEAITLIEQQLDKLLYYHSEPLKEVAEILMGIEGIAARAYWQAIAACMPPEFTFEDRNRHPAQDFFNAAINYLYGMLYTYVETALFSVGLDPYLGILHADQYDKPTLSYDLIEPFRPWIDRLVVENVLADKIKPDFFENKQGGVWLAQKGKQFLIPLLNTFLAESGELENSRAIRKNHIYRLAGDLVDTIQEKIV